MLLDLLEDRYGNGSIIVTSQLPFEEFYTFLEGATATLAEAIIEKKKKCCIIDFY